MYIINIIDFFEKLIKPFREFLERHYTNPFLWLAFFFIGLLVFKFTYNALKKEK